MPQQGSPEKTMTSRQVHTHTHNMHTQIQKKGKKKGQVLSCFKRGKKEEDATLVSCSTEDVC